MSQVYGGSRKERTDTFCGCRLQIREFNMSEGRAIEAKGRTPLVQVPSRMEEEKNVINVIRVKTDIFPANDAA